MPYLAMEKPEFAANPFPHFAAARQQHPWLAKCSLGYVIHEYAAIRDLVMRNDEFRGSYDGIVELMGAKGTPWGRFTEAQMLAHDGDYHKKLRSVLAPKFLPKQANLNRQLMQEVISKLLDEWAPKGAFDFEEFASYFPITVMCRMIGASPDVVPAIRKSLEALGLGFSMNRDHLPALQEAIVVLDEFVQQLVAQRRAGQRAADRPDLLDSLIGVQAEGGMTERELYDVLIFLFVAGYDTSKNVLTMMMNLLLDRPGDLRALRGGSCLLRQSGRGDAPLQQSGNHTAHDGKGRRLSGRLAAAGSHDLLSGQRGRARSIGVRRSGSLRSRTSERQQTDRLRARRTHLPRPVHRPRPDRGRAAPDRSADQESQARRSVRLAALLWRVGHERAADRVQFESRVADWPSSPASRMHGASCVDVIRRTDRTGITVAVSHQRALATA